MSNDRNKHFSRLINKVKYYSVLRTVICILTVTVTPYCSDIPSVGVYTTSCA